MDETKAFLLKVAATVTGGLILRIIQLIAELIAK